MNRINFTLTALRQLAGWGTAAAAALALTATAQAQNTKVTVAISGWTGFAPLVLAYEAGLFKQQGLDVSIK